MNLPEIASRMFNTPLLLHPGKGEIIARAFGPRVLGQPVEIRGGENFGLIGDPMGQWLEEDQPRRKDGIAVIEIEGSLVNKGKWIGKSSGTTSYEGIISQALAIMDDPSIRGVVYEVDSPGGEVTGAFDCAEVLFELSQVKPTIAVLTDHACSAGYLLASTARQMMIPSTGLCGSVGVISMHVDISAWLEKEGLSVTILKAGARKADMNQFEALPKDVLEEQLAELEEMRREFAATVARYRAGRLTLESVLATEAGVYRGEKAVEAGLADAVARPSQVLAAFEAALAA